MARTDRRDRVGRRDHAAGRVVLGLSLIGAMALTAALWTGRVERLSTDPA